MNKILLIALISLFFFGCKSKKKIVSTPAEKEYSTQKSIDFEDIKNASQLVESSESIDFRWVRMSGTIKSPQSPMPINTTIKMKKDSIVWGFANVFVEVGRLLINNDSGVMINRLGSEYIVMNKKDLGDLIGRDDFSLFNAQELILGQLPSTINSAYNFNRKDTTIELSFTNGTFQETMTVGRNRNLYKYTAEKNNGERVEISYSNFININSKLFPTTINMITKGRGNYQINISNINYAFNETDAVAFTIPSGFKKKNR